MNRITLIVLGLASAIVTAAGMMWYNSPLNTALRQLHDKDIGIRYQAHGTILRLGDERLIPKITRLLQDSDPKVRMAMPSLLVYFGDKESIPKITKLLSDMNPLVRGSAIQALCEIPAKEAIVDITKLLQDSNPYVRAWAICASGHLGAKETIPEIKKLLNNEDQDVRKAAEEALKELGVPEEEIQKAKDDATEELEKPIKPQETHLKAFTKDIEHKEFFQRYSQWAYSLLEFYPDSKARIGYFSCTQSFGRADEPNGEFIVEGYEIKITVDAKKIQPSIGELEYAMNRLEAELIKNNSPVDKSIEQKRSELKEREARIQAEWSGHYILYEGKTHYFIVDRRNLKGDKVPETLTLPSKEFPSYYYEKK